MLDEMIEVRKQIVATVRDFVQREVSPVADAYDKEDIYPEDLVEQMRHLGLFGITIPEKYSGLGLDYTTFAMIFEELAKGWMSLTGPLGTHSIMAYVIGKYGREEQIKHWLPRLARGDIRGGLALSEPNAGSDVASIETTAIKDGEEYILNGRKMFITNGQHGNAFLVLSKTDKSVKPAHKGISAFIAEKGPGFTVGRHLDKLGYRGVDTCELIFQDFRIPAENLIGTREGQGFYQVMDGLETGRINIGARAVGIATAAFETAIKYAQQRRTFGVPVAQHQAIQLMLADMATKVHAARLIVYDAAAKKDRNERCDLEAGMAKLFASEICAQVTLDAMRIHGGYGYIKELSLERYFREAPLMIIGEGTNEIQKIVIARNLLKQYAI
jgi:alkylation response protein AidB-like acyl-CoA dehydrogenase